MNNVLAGLRRKAADALSGRMGPRAQHLAWSAARLHPVLRAAREAKRGHIRSALAMLERASPRFAEAVRLRERLADMATFCEAFDGGALPTVPRATVRAAFNHRVLFALHSCGAFDPSGYASRSVALISALKSRGVVPVITTRPGYPWDLAHHRDTPKSSDVEYRGLQFHLEPQPEATLRDPESRYIEAYASRLQALARAHQVSVIHAASNYLNGAAAAAAGQATGIPSIYELRGLWHLTRAFSEPGYDRTEHFHYCERRELAACAAVDHVITLSDGLRQWLVERGIAADKISIVGNAAHVPGGSEHDRQQAALAVRERHRIPTSARVIGYLGAIVEYEGLDALIRAHARTPQTHRPFLLIVGGGKQEAALHHLVSELGTGRQVVYAGRVSPDEVPAHYAAMDAVMLPRRDHILTRLVPAIKPFEVLAHGRPLFVSPVLAQALADTLPNGYHVLDLDSVGRLDRILDDLPQAGPAVQVPTWDDRAELMRACYQRLAGGAAAV
jgi:glycosyltransferase involved in cell wall biosynthesis